MTESELWKPLEISPSTTGAEPGADGLLGWLSTQDIGSLLVDHKALVFRGFGVTPATLNPVIDVLLPNRLAYVHGNSPRTKVGDNLYTSTDYPPEFTISMHNEMSYAARWPTRLMFFCQQAPTSGGATPVVDGRLWLDAIRPEVREAFAGGVRYIQNLHGGLGLGKSWQATFETDDREVVETFLKDTDAEWEWRADDALWISQVRPATIRHPVSGLEVWFNQADQWHVAGLGEEAADLIELLSEDEAPQSVQLADGSPIPAEWIVHIQQTGLDHAVDVDWREGDLMVIDNVLVGHGRRPYAGPRRVLVAMSD
ncbi:TauD/TfdA family dioxygenase [Plantactinospora sp. ZYX-F-223]|uniref:TauD/TfdA family dioxygenase n=1 Tax=Plantactinospora sp. ZYX-F-223 TaxID=3144103 RepID=UPI0031FD645F